MQDQRSPEPAEDAAGYDHFVLDLLLNERSRRCWSVEEIARELGDAREARDALTRLCDAGFVDHLNGFVFAGRLAE